MVGTAPARLAPLVFPALGQHTATMFVNHGLGDTGAGWSHAVTAWRKRDELQGVKFILPHAPSIPITANGGMSSPGWFDLPFIDGNPESLWVREDVPGITTSQQYFHRLIQSEIDAGIPSHRIVLAGFSQGGAISLYAGLTAPVKLGAIISMSGWLLRGPTFGDVVAGMDKNKDTPILMAHGSMDPLIRPQLGRKSRDKLKLLGYKVSWNEYQMGHAACPEELDDVAKFLAENLAPPAATPAESDEKSEL